MIHETISKIRNGQNLSSAEKQEYILYSISHHTGKMYGIDSISTSNLENPFCIARKDNKSFICYACYANTYLVMRKTLREKMVTNTMFYTLYEISEKDVPLLNNSVFRFESFGDINNGRQFKNFCTIAKVNNHCTFTLWTKNLHVIEREIKSGTGKPGNMIIIYSVPKLNWKATKRRFDRIRKRFPFIDKIFVVWDRKLAERENVVINCAKKCLPCLKCYKREDNTNIIIEGKK